MLSEAFRLENVITSWEYNVYWLFMQTESKARDWTLSFPKIRSY